MSDLDIESDILSMYPSRKLVKYLTAVNLEINANQWIELFTVNFL